MRIERRFLFTENRKFLSHVLRNFIEDLLVAVPLLLDAPFLSHVLRNFIEENAACTPP